MMRFQRSIVRYVAIAAMIGMLLGMAPPGTFPTVYAEEPVAASVEPADIIIDNGGTGYSEVGSWLDSSLTGFDGSGTRYTNTSGNTAQWETNAPVTGDYNVYVWYPFHTNSATSVQYTMVTANGSWTQTVNQTQNAGQWHKIGTVGGVGGTAMSVIVKATSNAGTRADAVRFEQIPAATPTPTPSSTPSPTPTTSPQSIVIDNGGTGYSEVGTWLDSSLTGFEGSSTRYSNTPGNTAKWETNAPATGNYNVYVWYPLHTSNATSVQYTITTANGIWTHTANQSQSAGQWHKIGTISGAGDTAMSVVLKAVSTQATRADAVRFESTTDAPGPTASPSPTPTPTPTPVPQPAEFIPSFESISVYLPGEGTGSTVKLFYKEAGTTEWKTAFDPVYDGKLNQFRGSIVKLFEDTVYDVKAEIYQVGQLVKTETATVTTWTSNPVIAETIPLSSLYSGGVLNIDGMVGSENGWIKIINDTGMVIDGQKLGTAAVRVTNSKYLILENFIVRGGSRHGIMLNNTSSYIRIINADISGWGREVVGTTETGELGQPLDSEGNEINNDAGIAIYDGYNIVVERSYIHEPNGWANAWGGVTMGGQTYSHSHPEGPNAVFLRGKGGIVLRYNDFVGSDANRYNDVVETYFNENSNGGPYRDADIYGNYLGFGNDDAMELDGGQMNIRFYNNRNEQTYCGVSIVPNMLGPSYVFNNISFNMGDFRGSGGGAVVKGGGNESLGLGWSFLFNNTYFTKTNGFANYGFQSRSDMRAYTRNNIIVLMRSPANGVNNIRDSNLRPENSFDYDALGNTTTSDGVGGITAYPGNETHAQWGVAAMDDPLHGVFTLKSTVGAKEVNVIDKGAVIPNFTDQYSGSAPDIGAIESGESSLFPKRPIPLTSDKYNLRILPEVDSGTFTISPGSYSGPYTIRKAASDDWYTVTPTSGTFTANSSITFTVTVDRSKASFDKSWEFSTLFVRLPDGYSVPVSITGFNTVTSPSPTPTPTPTATPTPSPTPIPVADTSIPAVTQRPLIDGESDSVWNMSAAHSISNVTRGEEEPTSADLSGTWKGAWDSDNLYMQVRVTDDLLINDSAAAWDDDSVELYIDADNSKKSGYDGKNDFQFVFGYNDAEPQEVKLKRTAGVVFAKKDTPDGYVMEIRIPWSTLGVTPSTGGMIGLDVAVNDDDDGDGRDHKKHWKARSDQTWSDPSLFGNAELTDPPAPVPSSVSIMGPDSIPVPHADTISARHTADVRDSEGRVMEEEEVVWSVEAAPEGVVVDGITGTVTVGRNAEEGTVILKASSRSTPSVYGILPVKLVKAQGGWYHLTDGWKSLQDWVDQHRKKQK